MIIPPPIKFCIVGASGVLVNTGILYLCKEYAGFPLLLASGVAILTAMLWNFYWNDAWTFGGVESKNPMHSRLVLFCVLCTIGVAINMGTLWVLDHYGVWYIFANVVGIAAATGWNYVLNKKVTWG